MGVKGSRGKPNSSSNEVTLPRSWPDLPREIIQLLPRNSSLMQYIGFGGLTKTWRETSRKCNTSLSKPALRQLYDNCRKQTHPMHIFKISFYKGYYVWYGNRNRMPWRKDLLATFAGYSHGLLISRQLDAASRGGLWDCVIPVFGYHSMLSIPTWDLNIPFKFATLSSAPWFLSLPFNLQCLLSTSPDIEKRSPSIVLALTGICSPAFAFYCLTWRSINANSWTMQDSILIDPYSSDKKLMQFTNAIGVGGRFYVLSLQGTLAVMEYIDSELRITALGKNRGVPSVPSRHYKEFLIESDGDILLVFLISKKFSDIVDEVEIFKLELPRLSWVKMKSIGNRTMFVGSDSCMVVAASKVGCRSNCIYYIHSNAVDWWLYDMNSKRIVTDWNNVDSGYNIPS